MVTLKDKEFLARCFRSAAMNVPLSSPSSDEIWKNVRMTYIKEFLAFNAMLRNYGFEIVKTSEIIIPEVVVENTKTNENVLDSL